MALDAAIIDALGEIGNIATGAASTALSELMEKDVRITTPEVEPIAPGALVERYQEPSVVIQVDYSGGLEGQNLLVLGQENARELAEAMLASYGQVPEAEPGQELTEVELSAVSEIMNQMMGASAKAYGDILSEVVDISPPQVEVRELTTELMSDLEDSDDSELVTISFTLIVDGTESTQVLQAMEAPFAEELASTMMSSFVLDDEPAEEEEAADAGEEEPSEEQPSTPSIVDVLGEIGNIATGAASTSLSELMEKDVRITTPDVKLADPKELAGEHEEQCVVTQIDFSGGLVGENLLLLSLENARKLAAVMLASYGQVPEEVPGDDLTEVELSAVSEIMNQMMGASAKAYGELLSEVVEITPPDVEVRDVTGSLMSDLEDGEDSELVTTSFSLMVDGEVSTQVLQVMEAPFARELASTMMNSFVIDEEPEEPVEDDNAAAVKEPAAPGTHTEAQGASAAAIIDVLGEIGNIATGAASTALAQLMEKDVRITTPEVEPTGPESLVEQYPVPCVVAKISFKGGIKGENLLLLRVENARELAEVMLASYGQVPTTESSDELTEVELSAVSEIMNQMMGASAKAYGELLSEVVEISPPDLEIREVTTDLVSGYEGMPDEDLITIRFSLMVDGAMATQVLQVMEAPFARELASTMITGQLASTMMSSVVGDNEPEAESPSPGPQDSQEPAAVEPTGLAAEGIDDLLGGEAAEEKEAAAAQEDEQNEGRLELPYLTKFSVTISALFGRATPSLETLASLDRGSALQLNRQVDEAVLLRVNDMDFAYGELVTVDGQIGVRIVGFIEPEPGGGILDERAYSE